MPSANEYIAWDDLRIVLAVAEAESFTAAARALRLGQPTISRRIAQLEARLEAPLFTRGVDGAHVTEAGARLMPALKRMADAAGDVSRLARSDKARPTGRVRIAAPPGLAVDFLAPFARTLRARHPDLRLEVLSSLRVLDLARGEADLSIRTRCPNAQDLVCLAELEVQMAAFAARNYERSLPPGFGLGDVDWIGWAPPYQDLSPNPELAAAIPDFVPAFTSDSYLVQIRAAETGVGAMVLPRIRHAFMRDRSLVELDLDLGAPKGSLHLVSAKTGQVVPRIRAVVELVTEFLHETEGARLRPGGG